MEPCENSRGSLCYALPLQFVKTTATQSKSSLYCAGRSRACSASHSLSASMPWRCSVVAVTRYGKQQRLRRRCTQREARRTCNQQIDVLLPLLRPAGVLVSQHPLVQQRRQHWRYVGLRQQLAAYVQQAFRCIPFLRRSTGSVKGRRTSSVQSVCALPAAGGGAPSENTAPALQSSSTRGRRRAGLRGVKALSVHVRLLAHTRVLAGRYTVNERTAE